MDFKLLDSIFSTLRLDPPSKLVLLEADSLRSIHVPPYPPDCPALILNLDSHELAFAVKTILLANYPASFSIRVIHEKEIQETSVEKLDGLNQWNANTSLYVPSLGEGTSFEAFHEIVAHLRAPNGCPWDREQTHESLRTNLLEEAYETLDTIDKRDFTAMHEEFGDLMLQVLLHSQIAYEESEFSITEVIKGICDKLVRRHPHVFGDVKVNSVNDVLQNWEKVKETERKTKGEKQKGFLDGIPAALPALGQAQEYQSRAARVGFDWPEIDGVLDKIKEEIQEVKEADGLDHITEEVGDLLFALVNLARWKKVDAESALRGTNLKFKRRFAHIETGARSQGKNLSDLSLDEMESLWQEAKKKE